MPSLSSVARLAHSALTTTGGVTSPTTVLNPNYLVQIVGTDNDDPAQKVVVTGWAHEDGLSITFESSFEAYASGPQKFKATQGAAGYALFNQYFTAKYWTGSTSPSLRINFTFVAHNDPVKDIVQPVRSLIKLTLPRAISRVAIEAPGPSLIGQLFEDDKATKARVTGALSWLEGITNSLTGSSVDFSSELRNSENITFKFGRFVEISPIIVTNVNMDAKPKFDARGNPISLGCSVEFQSFYNPFKNDIDGDNKYGARQNVFRIGA